MLKLLIFRLLVAGMVTVYGPLSILSAHPAHGRLLSALGVVGVLLIASGILLYVRCISDFALGGQLAAQSILVARGVYRVVRNPMYLGLVLLLLGEGLVFRSWRLLGYAAVLWLGMELLVRFYEERELANRFGGSYAQYCQETPRWIPRVRRHDPAKSGQAA